MSLLYGFNSACGERDYRWLASGKAVAVQEMVELVITMSAAALTIQKSFRGFLARKNVAAIRHLEAEVEDVEIGVKESENRSRADAEEGTRANEALTSLLFRLDCVRGVGDYRRRVIRKAIEVQQAVKPLVAMSAAALRIQKIFRAFLVRKNMSALHRLKSELDVVERVFKESDNCPGVDEKEGIRLNEALMSLLFRLDSVRWVTGYRRRVIQRAIAVLEAVDVGTAMSAAASTIQKTFRGFLARKHVRALRRLEIEVEGIEKAMKASEDPNEAIRVNEMLTSLLLRLDSFSNIMRDYSSGVILKVIAIQEAVQASITASAAAVRIQRTSRGFLARRSLRSVRLLESEVETVERLVKDSEVRLDADEKERIRVIEVLMSLLFRLDSVRGVRNYRRRVIARVIAVQEAVDAIAVTSKEQAERLISSSMDASEEDTPNNLSPGEILMEVRLADSERSEEREPIVSHKSGESPLGLPPCPVFLSTVEGDVEDGRRCVTHVLERLVGENKVLKGLVIELCEKNEMQFHLISSLSKSVERLEKAVKKVSRQSKRKASQRKALVRKSERNKIS